MKRLQENDKVQVKLHGDILTAIIKMVAVNGYIIEFQCHDEKRQLDFITDKQIIPA